jgi:hypothetical protein
MQKTTPHTDLSVWGAQDYGFIVMNFDPAVASATLTTRLSTAGRMNIHRLDMPVPSRVTNIVTWIADPGVTLTANRCYASLYDSSQNLLGQTADQSGTWNSTGLKTMALTSPVNVPAGDIFIGLWYSGTTAPGLLRGQLSDQVTNEQNLPTPYRVSLGATGLTTTAPSSIGAVSSSSTVFWVAVS